MKDTWKKVDDDLKKIKGILRNKRALKRKGPV